LPFAAATNVLDGRINTKGKDYLDSIQRMNELTAELKVKAAHTTAKRLLIPLGTL
jgi:hypothetical protein